MKGRLKRGRGSGDGSVDTGGPLEYTGQVIFDRGKDENAGDGGYVIQHSKT